MKNLYFNKCSCVLCRKEINTRGFFNHFSVMHTRLGKKRAIFNGNLGVKNTIKNNNENKDVRVKIYLKNPKLCKFCKNIIPYEKKSNSYCDHSCSASSTNITNRGKYNTKRRICPVSFCITRGGVIRNKRIKYCDDCLLEFRKEFGSAIAIKNNFGGVRQSCRINYNGVMLGSSYELLVAESLDNHKIKWKQPGYFRYIDPTGKERRYTADFFLPDYDVYLDPKNDFLINNVNPSLGFCDIDKIKIVENTHNIRILVLNKNQLSWDIISKLVGCTGFEPVYSDM